MPTCMHTVLSPATEIFLACSRFNGAVVVQRNPTFRAIRNSEMKIAYFLRIARAITATINDTEMHQAESIICVRLCSFSFVCECSVAGGHITPLEWKL